MSTISERLGISNEIHELKFGKSFTNGNTNASKLNSNRSRSFNHNNNDNSPNESFHTIRYDFKPVSVDTSQTASIEFNEKNKITVTAPNVEGSGVSCTVFQGSRKPHLKECVLVFDHETGDITLERLTHNIVVKKTRAEGSSKIVNQVQRPITPAGLNQKSVSPKLNNNHQLMNGSTRSPQNNYMTNASSSSSALNGNASSSTHRSPKDKQLNSTNINQTNTHQPLNSMPIFNSSTLTNASANNFTRNTFSDCKVGVLSSSSSSSSSDDDSSSSSSDSSSSDDDDDDDDDAQIDSKVQAKTTSSMQASSNLHTNSSLANSKAINMSASSSDEMDSDDDDDDDEKLSSLNNNLINSLNNGLSNVGISNGPIGFSMPKLSDLNDDLQLSESGSDSD